MIKSAALLLLACISTVAQAQPATISVEMTNFAFAPSQLELKASTLVLLLLRNDASGGHSFSAPAFFAASRLDPSSARLVRDGKVEVPAHQSVHLEIIPAAGDYPLKCSHTLHAMFGMKGRIVVR